METAMQDLYRAYGMNKREIQLGKGWLLFGHDAPHGYYLYDGKMFCARIDSKAAWRELCGREFMLAARLRV